MTIPASPTNNMGGYYTSNTPVNSSPEPAPGTPPTPPNTPDSTSGVANARTSGFNFVHGITSTQQYLQNGMRILE
jgi:hypothetical protein